MPAPELQEVSQDSSTKGERAHGAPPLAEQVIAAGGRGVTSIFLGGVWLLLGCPSVVADPNPRVLGNSNWIQWVTKRRQRRKGHWGMDPKGVG